MTIVATQKRLDVEKERWVAAVEKERPYEDDVANLELFELEEEQQF